MNIPDWIGFVWVLLETGEIELAYYSNGNFQTAETVGDREGLMIEYYNNVKAWASLKEPNYSEMITI